MERKIYILLMLFTKTMKHPHNFYVEDEIWKEFKKACIDKNKTATSVLEEFVKNEVKKHNKRN